jgi:Sulfotransferase family
MTASAGSQDVSCRDIDAQLAAASAQARARVPDFFIVGHAKCGTTSLHKMLARHPQIFMSDPKEPWFFARDNPDPQISGERSMQFTGRKFESLDDYLSLFADARPDQRVGEASSSYLWSPTAPARIAAMRPDARIVAMFREPASFLHSLHLQLLSSHEETEKSFRKAVELEGERRENRQLPKYAYWPQTLMYCDRVRYVEQLSRYRAAFAPEQLLVLIYDDFRADNEATLSRLLGFLGVDDAHPVKRFEANRTVGVRSVRLDEFRRSLRAGRGPGLRALRGVGKALTTRRLREAVYYPLLRRTVYTKAPPVDDEFMVQLRRRFKPEVVALGEYLDRDLVSLWGYDAIK